VIKTNRTSVFFPDYVARTIVEIHPLTLKQLGITHVVFDIDSTLVPHRGDTVTPEYIHHIKMLREQGLTILIGSNTRRDITALAASIDAVVTVPAGMSVKPRKSFYRRIVTVSGTLPKHIAMVGDHIINDIVGPNRIGFTTILVEPVGRIPSWVFRTYTRIAAKKH
jgi:HAD superfamily phosphatase (TIGR01668 family)